MTEGNEAHVHHLLIYLCDTISEHDVGNGGPCEIVVPRQVSACRDGALVGGWAVGGEVSFLSLICYKKLCGWL